jgi:ribosomal-protein-alanine N-acetyltransferase
LDVGREAVKQLRRLDTVVTQDAYRKAQRGALRYLAIPEEDFRRLEQERPELVVVDGDAVLAGWPRPPTGAGQRLSLQYAFRDRDSFARQFPPMFERLVPAARSEEAGLGIEFRLTNRSARPYVEPLLFSHAFELNREWLEMTLLDLPADAHAGDDVAQGFRLRRATPADAEAMMRLEELCFPNSASLTVTRAIEALRAAELRVLEDAATAALAGSLMLEQRSPSRGYIATVAVHPEFQRRGLGEALMRWALARFREQGMRSASLTVSTWNAGAIALYRKLGFAVAGMGLDYRRPIDEDEVRQVLEKHRAAHIRVRKNV